jgi:hypothetical protein
MGKRSNPRQREASPPVVAGAAKRKYSALRTNCPRVRVGHGHTDVCLGKAGCSSRDAVRSGTKN